MAAYEASDRAIEYRASIGCTYGPPEMINARALNEGIITVRIESRATHLDCRMAIQGTRSKAFINAYQGLHPDCPSRSNGHDIFETVHDGPFHRSRRSFRSDGYTQIAYK